MNPFSPYFSSAPFIKSIWARRTCLSFIKSSIAPVCELFVSWSSFSFNLKRPCNTSICSLIRWFSSTNLCASREVFNEGPVKVAGDDSTLNRFPDSLWISSLTRGWDAPSFAGVEVIGVWHFILWTSSSSWSTWDCKRLPCFSRNSFSSLNFEFSCSIRAWFSLRSRNSVSEKLSDILSFSLLSSSCFSLTTKASFKYRFSISRFSLSCSNCSFSFWIPGTSIPSVWPDLLRLSVSRYRTWFCLLNTSLALFRAWISVFFL